MTNRNSSLATPLPTLSFIGADLSLGARALLSTQLELR
jgi:hypothetical protein